MVEHVATGLSFTPLLDPARGLAEKTVGRIAKHVSTKNRQSLLIVADHLKISNEELQESLSTDIGAATKSFIDKIGRSRSQNLSRCGLEFLKRWLAQRRQQQGIAILSFTEQVLANHVATVERALKRKSCPSWDLIKGSLLLMICSLLFDPDKEEEKIIESWQTYSEYIFKDENLVYRLLCKLKKYSLAKNRSAKERKEMQEYFTFLGNGIAEILIECNGTDKEGLIQEKVKTFMDYIDSKTVRVEGFKIVNFKDGYPILWFKSPKMASILLPCFVRYQLNDRINLGGTREVQILLGCYGQALTCCVYVDSEKSVFAIDNAGQIIAIRADDHSMRKIFNNEKKWYWIGYAENIKTLYAREETEEENYLIKFNVSSGEDIGYISLPWYACPVVAPNGVLLFEDSVVTVETVDTVRIETKRFIHFPNVNTADDWMEEDFEEEDTSSHQIWRTFEMLDERLYLITMYNGMLHKMEEISLNLVTGGYSKTILHSRLEEVLIRGVVDDKKATASDDIKIGVKGGTKAKASDDINIGTRRQQNKKRAVNFGRFVDTMDYLGWEKIQYFPRWRYKETPHLFEEENIPYLSFDAEEVLPSPNFVAGIPYLQLDRIHEKELQLINSVMRSHFRRNGLFFTDCYHETDIDYYVEWSPCIVNSDKMFVSLAHGHLEELKSICSPLNSGLIFACFKQKFVVDVGDLSLA